MAVRMKIHVKFMWFAHYERKKFLNVSAAWANKGRPIAAYRSNRNNEFLSITENSD